METTKKLRPLADRLKIAAHLLQTLDERATYGSWRASFTEGRDRDLCEIPVTWSNLVVEFGEPGRKGNFTATVDLMDPDAISEGIDKLVNFGLLPVYYDPEAAL